MSNIVIADYTYDSCVEDLVIYLKASEYMCFNLLSKITSTEACFLAAVNKIDSEFMNFKSLNNWGTEDEVIKRYRSITYRHWLDFSELLSRLNPDNYFAVVDEIRRRKSDDDDWMVMYSKWCIDHLVRRD